MSTDTTTEVRTGAPTTRPGPRPPSPPSAGARALRAVEAFLASKRTALAVMLAMAGLALVGALVDQSPSVVRDDPAAYGAWLDSVRPTYGALTDRLYALGLFHIFASVWFKIAAGLMVASILTNTAQRLPGLWRRAARPQVLAEDRVIDHAALRAVVATPLDVDDAVVGVTRALRGSHFRVLAAPADNDVVVYADRFRFQPLATVVSHAAVVLVILGIVLTASGGFRDEEFAVTVGNARPIGHGTGLAIRVDGFTDAYDPQGNPTDYASSLTLLRGDAAVLDATVRVNQPLRAEGLSVYQSYFGNAAVLTVQPPRSAAITADLPLQWRSGDGTRMIGRWVAPDDEVVLVVQGPAPGRVDASLPPGDLRVTLVGPHDARLADETVSPGESVSAGGWRVTFEREQPFTGLIVARDPGAIWVWTGSLLMIAGLLGSLAIRHRRIWVRLRPTPGGTEITVAAPDHRRDGPISAWFDRATDAVRSGLATPTTPTPRGGRDA